MKHHRLLALFLGLFGCCAFSSFYLSAQNIGTPLIVPQQFFDNNGDPLAGGLISTYVAGTSTSAVTYTNHTLATAASNPIVLDSAGRTSSPIYLAVANYKFVVATSANVILLTWDNIYSSGQAAYSVALDNSVCDARLTATSATPVPDSDVTAATTVYVTPYGGNRCAVYDGTNWVTRTFSEISLSLGSDATNTNFDVFVYDNAGTLAMERLAWANSTARSTALVLQDGILSKSGQLTRRYIGSYRTTGTVGQTEDSVGKRFVYNYYHRVRRPVRRLETTDTWTYTTATWRVANDTTSNQINVLSGQELDIELTALATAENTGTAATMHTGIGEDITTSPVTGGVIAGQQMAQANTPFTNAMSTARQVSLGYHYYAWLERSAASGTTTWYGDQGAGGTYQTGLVGTIVN